MEKSRIFFISLVLILTIPQPSKAGSFIKIDERYQQTNPSSYESLNAALHDQLKIPYYFTVPVQSFADIPDTAEPIKNLPSSPAILFNYRHTRKERTPDKQLGLRLLVVNGSRPRTESSQVLADTGLIQDGDVLLSFRPEWYETLRYSHIQLGVSHAGVAYVDRAADGKRHIYNLDMPLDEETVGADKKSRLSSKHYLDAPLVHVLRPKNVSDKQRKNILGWLRLLAASAKRAYKSLLFFNSDYASPNFRRNAPLKFVGDLGRIALRSRIETPIQMYCSEFAWSLLALRDCDPISDAASFQNEDAPSCIKPIFDPMPVTGTFAIAADKTSPDLTIGLVDGPVIMTDTLVSKEAGLEVRNRLIHRLFSLASGKPEHISSGHKAVETAILKDNPDFYQHLETYYQMTGIKNVDADPRFQAVAQAFNSSQLENYSPTSFQIHALLPREAAIKAFEYVATLAYVPAAHYLKLLRASSQK